MCLRSLALAVAAQCGMPPELLRAAAAHEARLRAMLAAARQQAYGGSHVPLYGPRVWDGAGEGAGEAAWGKAAEGQGAGPSGGDGGGGAWDGAVAWGESAAGAQEELGAAANSAMLLLPRPAEQQPQQVQEEQQQDQLGWVQEEPVQQQGQEEQEFAQQQESVQQQQLPSPPPAADPAPALGGFRDVPLEEAAGVLRAVLLAALAKHTPEGVVDNMIPELGGEGRSGRWRSNRG